MKEETEEIEKRKMSNEYLNILALYLIFNSDTKLKVFNLEIRYLEEKFERYISSIDNIKCNINYATVKKYEAIWNRNFSTRQKKLITACYKISELPLNFSILKNILKIIDFKNINSRDDWKWGIHPMLLDELDNMNLSLSKYKDEIEAKEKINLF